VNSMLMIATVMMNFFCNGVETCDASQGCQAGTSPCFDFGTTCDEDSQTCISCSIVENFDKKSGLRGTGGWSTEESTCFTGGFQIGRPTKVVSRGVVLQVNGDHTSGQGYALFTSPNTRVGRDDVDAGACVATSPTYDVTDPSLFGIWYFFGQRNNGDDSDDGFKLELLISNEDGQTTTELVTIGDTRHFARWTYASARIPGNSKIQVRVAATDGRKKGDFIEAGLDDMTICPTGISDPLSI